jgi:transposase
MNKKYYIKLSEEEKRYTHTIMNDPKTPETFRKRSHILLLADESVGKPPKQAEIAERCAVTDVTVYQTIRDFCEHGLEYALHYKRPADPPRKPIVTGEKEARIIALACGTPPVGFSRWTVRLLAKKAVELEIVETICPETIRTTLKKRNLSLT